MAEIKIYGDIVPFKWFNDGSEYDLKDLDIALSALSMKEGEELIVGIHTFGGCTTTAFGIFSKLRRFKKENKINLTTRVEGWCASSGVIVLLAGDKRIGNKFAEPFVHNAWTWVMTANKHEAEKIMEDLTKVDDQIATLYEDRTDITKEKALELMDSDTFISAEDCMTYGFYTELEDVYAAENALIFNSLRQRRQNNSNNNNTEMRGKSKNQKPEKKTLVQELKNLVNVFTGGSNNKIVFTAENKELDFYELAEDATPVVGDKALFDGKPAGESNDGEYVLATGETYKFTGEELTEIIPVDEGDSTDLETENAELKSENEKLKGEIAKLTSENKSLNLKVKTANKIVNKFNSLDLSEEDDDEEDDDEDEFAYQGGVSSRESKPVNRKKSNEVVKTSDLFNGIK